MEKNYKKAELKMGKKTDFLRNLATDKLSSIGPFFF